MEKQELHPLGPPFALDAPVRPRLELEQIYREHSAAVSRWLRRLWGPGRRGGMVDEEDLLHEVFLVAQRRLPSFRGDASVTTWLYSIAVHVVNARRSKERWRALLFRRAEPELAADLAPAAPEEMQRQEASRVVYSILDDLSERDRTLLILFELERLPGAAVAAILGLSEASLWVALSRARARFKRAFECRYGDLSDEGTSDAKL